MMKIVKIPNPILNQPVKRVINFDDSLKSLVSEMEKTLAAQTDPPGVGLAAPQVGKNLALFVIKPNKRDKARVFVNPKIVASGTWNVERGTKKNTKSKTKNQKLKLEGCLSIPRIWGPVTRQPKITLQYQTISGDAKTEEFSGFIATIIQHEIDHLQGILFTQRALEQNQPLYEEKEGKLEKIEY